MLKHNLPITRHKLYDGLGSPSYNLSTLHQPLRSYLVARHQPGEMLERPVVGPFDRRWEVARGELPVRSMVVQAFAASPLEPARVSAVAPGEVGFEVGVSAGVGVAVGVAGGGPSPWPTSARARRGCWSLWNFRRMSPSG